MPARPPLAAALLLLALCGCGHTAGAGAPITRHEVGRRFAGAVVHGDTVYLAGDVAKDASQDVAGQTAQVLAQLDARLASLGLDKRRLLSVTVYLADIGDFEAMNAVWEGWLAREHAPVRATVEARLARPALRIEVVAVAAR
jgi:enamine deaminase RidA (YjgF/YER057c/UK114 family)